MLRGVDVDIRIAGGHCRQHITQVFPATRIAGLGARERGLDLPFRVHRTGEKRHPYRAARLGPSAVDVSGERGSRQVIPLELVLDARPIRLELGVAGD